MSPSAPDGARWLREATATRDDYGGIEACRQAVTDYRASQGITAEIHAVDWTAVWWRKP